jgi:hypothetical protein
MYHCTAQGPSPVAESARVVDVGVDGAAADGTSVAQPARTIKNAPISLDIDHQTFVAGPGLSIDFVA